MRQAEVGSHYQSAFKSHVSDADQNRAANRALMVRLAHACVAFGLMAALALSFWLKPDPRGLGTHEQVLLLPCNFYVLTGLPCPFCGMTTAFTHMARGEIREAFFAQPLGVIGFVACVLLLPAAIGAAISGRDAIGAAMKLPWGRLTWVLTAMILVSWIFKLTIVLLR